MPTIMIAADTAPPLRREAIRIASALLCAGHGESRSCSTCRRVAEESHPDFLHVAPDGLQIKVEAVREAIRFGVGRPYEAPARVVWIESAEALRDGAAANALLKSLEEPGGFLTWILTTTAPEAILPTIRSRCQQRRLARRGPAEARAELVKRGLEPAAIDDAIAFGFDTEAEFDLDAARDFRRFALTALAAGEISALLSLAASAADEESGPSLVAGLLRDAAVLASGGPPDRLKHRSAASELAAVAGRYPAGALRRCAVEVDALPDRFNRFPQKRLAWEQALLELVES
jgi:DNA polymerase-3 subunit delta'